MRRLSNADGSACESVPYVLTSDEDSLRFLKNGSPYAQFIATVEWRYDLEPPTKTKTYVDFELIPGGYELTMPNCPAAVKKNGLLTGLPSLDALTPASLLALGHHGHGRPARHHHVRGQRTGPVRLRRLAQQPVRELPR